MAVQFFVGLNVRYANIFMALIFVVLYNQRNLPLPHKNFRVPQLWYLQLYAYNRYALYGVGNAAGATPPIAST